VSRATLHLPVAALGPAPWSPWSTACGRTVRDEGLAADPVAVTCRACLRTHEGREAQAEHSVLALGLPPTPAATRGTVPCDQLHGPTALQLAVQAGLPPQVLADLDARAALGRERYGVQLRAPWPQGLDEALPELLDAVAYLLVSGHAEALPMVRELVPLVERLQRLSRGLPAWPEVPTGW